MKKEKSPAPNCDKKKDLVSKLCRLSIDNNVFEGSTDLPQVFQVYISTFNTCPFHSPRMHLEFIVDFVDRTKSRVNSAIHKFVMRPVAILLLLYQ